MPELPEVQALVDFLAERTDGLAITSVELAVVQRAQDVQPAPAGARGRARRRRPPPRQVPRHRRRRHRTSSSTSPAPAGCAGPTSCPTTVVRPGKSPIALRVRLSDGSGFDLTEAGTKKSLAAYIVARPRRGARHRAARPRPAGRRLHARALPLDARRPPHPDQGPAARPGVHRRRRQRLLRRDPPRRQDQPLRHRRARSPPRSSTGCMPPCATRSTSAVATASGKPAKELKDAKRAGMRVHARTGSRAPSAATSCARCPSPTRRCSTAPPARPAASRSPTDGCPGCSSERVPPGLRRRRSRSSGMQRFWVVVVFIVMKPLTTPRPARPPPPGSRPRRAVAGLALGCVLAATGLRAGRPAGSASGGGRRWTPGTRRRPLADASPSGGVRLEATMAVGPPAAPREPGRRDAGPGLVVDYTLHEHRLAPRSSPTTSCRQPRLCASLPADLDPEHAWVYADSGVLRLSKQGFRAGAGRPFVGRPRHGRATRSTPGPAHRDGRMPCRRPTLDVPGRRVRGPARPRSTRGARVAVLRAGRRPRCRQARPAAVGAGVLEAPAHGALRATSSSAPSPRRSRCLTGSATSQR